MRSRYTAYVRRDEAYLLRTWEASHRPAVLGFDDTVWLGLDVLAADAGSPGDGSGTVTFVARYQRPDGSVEILRETSQFVKDNGEWVYVQDVE